MTTRRRLSTKDVEPVGPILPSRRSLAVMSKDDAPSYPGYILTPPLTPSTPSVSSPLRISTTPRAAFEPSEPETFALPPPMSPSDFGLTPADTELSLEEKKRLEDEAEEYAWKEGMSQEEKEARTKWLASGRERKGLRIVIVTENFLPKVDGVTRTLARLLEHLTKEGHQCMLLGPGSGMETYAGHPLVGTLGVPLVVYPGLKLNFLRPRFLRTIKEFQPDVVHFVDPIWLGAQTLMAMELGWAGEQWVPADGPALGSGINGPIVASYHTNLATYATLFGMPRLEPLLWKFQRWLYSKTLITLCPSPSTKAMLHSNDFRKVNLWPRGVDLSQFSPSKRSAALRAEWGVGKAPTPSRQVVYMEPLDVSEHVSKLPTIEEGMGVHYQGRKASLPLTPPESPAVGPDEAGAGIDEILSLSPISTTLDSVHHEPSAPSAPPATAPELPERVVLLFVGRISWEKNIHLLLAAYEHLPQVLPAGALVPKLVFVGDGPARAELQGICKSKGWDAEFMGQRVGEDLARCFASADAFAFPSFTETFGQVVLEAMASGLPVIGLDAEGTRDLVQPLETGLLLPLPQSTTSWPQALKSTGSTTFRESSRSYADLLRQIVVDHGLRAEMGRKASTQGIQGFTWWDAMEKCVDGYRESIRMTLGPAEGDKGGVEDDQEGTSGSSKRISTVNRVVSRTLAHRDAKRPDTRETIWHLKTLLKLVIMLGLVWVACKHHLAQPSPDASPSSPISA